MFPTYRSDARRGTVLLASAIVILLVAGLAFAAFPVSFLMGTNSFWRRPAGDTAEHIIGGRYFVADAWQFPLLFVPRLGVPTGTNIGLTDSIPLAALAAKLGRVLWGWQRPYLPVWILFCWIAQGVAGVVSLYVLQVRRVAPLVLGGLLVVFSPVLLVQFGHAALCGQFLLLLALAVHFASVGTSPRRWAWLFYLPLLVLALLVHVYLFAMVAGFALATLFHGLWTEQLTAQGALGRLLAMAAPVALVMVVLGYFTLGPVPLKPYGEWPLNLAAPFVPGWSAVTGERGAPPGVGFESYAWLGAGTTLLIVVALAAWRDRLRVIAADHGATVTVVVAVVVFAASFSVRLGPWVVLGVPFAPIRAAIVAGARDGGTVHRVLAALTPWDWARGILYVVVLLALGAWLLLHLWRHQRLQTLWFLLIAGVVLAAAVALMPHGIAVIVSNFQASARFVWMVLYLVAVLAIAGVWLAFPPRLSIGLLSLALALQIADTAPLWGMLRDDARITPPHLMNAKIIEANFARARDVVVVPTYLCSYGEGLGPEALAALTDRVTAVDLLASRLALPINSVRNSRMTAIHRDVLESRCSAARSAALAGLDAPGRVTVVLAGAPAESELRQQLAAQPECSALDVGVVCHGRGASSH